MRVGLDYRAAASYPNSGLGRQALALEQALRAHPDVQLQLFTVAPDNDPLRRKAHCPAWGSPLTGMHRLPPRIRFEAGFLPEALRKCDIQTYICNANMGLPLARKPAGVKYVLQLHDVFQLTLTNAHASKIKALIYGYTDKLSIRWSVNSADRIWTPSQYTADELVKLFPGARDKVRVLPNLVLPFTGELADISDLSLPTRYWLCVGTREPRKNIPWFVSAWQQARQQNAEVPDLVLVGSRDDLPSAQQHLHGIHFVSNLSDAQLHALYAGAARLWQPSYAEGFGLPVIEALAQGTPVAVAQGSALDEITPPDSPRFSPTDSDALVHLMKSLAVDHPVDTAALKTWAEGYGEQAYRQRFNALLEELR